MLPHRPEVVKGMFDINKRTHRQLRRSSHIVKTIDFL